MLHPELKDVLKKHQVEGIEFMWRNCFEDEISGGCVLAHNMGLGKVSL
jgi:SNF2 family DNA or RNA helicase